MGEPRRRWPAEVLRWTAAAAAGVGALAALVRLVLRDRVPVLATLYYATPPAGLALAAAFSAGAWALLRRKRPALVAAGAALACLAWHAVAARFDRPQATGDLRVVLWNVKNGRHGWEAVEEALRADGADLVALVEGFSAKAPMSRLMPDYEWAWPGKGLSVGVRGGRVVESTSYGLSERSWAALVRAEVRGRALSVLMVDIYSNPLEPRGEAFRALDDLRRELKPDLVLGNFNTPRDSVFFDEWRRTYRHAFEEAGKGWDATWPMPFPVLPIDQVWCAPTLVPRAAAHAGTGASWHRRVIVDVSPAPAPPGP